jgi:hypothetical protein
MVRFAPLPDLPPLTDNDLWSQGANLYDTVPRFRGLLPACYMAATCGGWRRLWDAAKRQSHSVACELDGNINDERIILRAAVAASMHIIRVPRAVGNVGQAAGRVERDLWQAALGQPMRLDGWVDGHLPRPAWPADRWGAIRRWLEPLVGAGRMALLDKFREDYVVAIQSVRDQCHSQ